MTTTARAQGLKIVLPDKQITLLSLFEQIKRQTGYTVVFDAGSTPPERPVTLPMQSGSVDQLLAAALPAARYSRQTIDNFIVVRTLPVRSSPTAPPPLQPSREEFESDVREYTRRHLRAPQAQTTLRYDTIRTLKPHSGLFDYPARQFTPAFTTRTVPTPFARTTPPRLAVKTNLLWWAARGTLNIGGEIGLSDRTTLELAGGLNRRDLEGSAENNKKLTHWVVKPEFRWWLCERFNGHFFGLHALYAEYNVGGYDIPTLFRKEFRYEGNAWGGGVNYGHHLPLSKRWGVEFTAGVGVLRMDYVKKDCEKCGSKVGDYQKTWFGPTELGVKLVLMID